MPAPQKIMELVQRFSDNYEHYQSSDYNEEDLRHDFLNPFFKALGWDMEDERGLGPRRDVRYENRIRTGAPDYGF
jgi:predicted type IV restriction endonuclease